MATMNDIVKLAIDTYHGTPEKYSVNQSLDVLRQAAIEANGGKTTLNYKDIRDGKCGELFTLMEEIISVVTVEGFEGSEFFNALVDYKNVAEGDKNVFYTEDDELFSVSRIANGTQSLRRQRLGGASSFSVNTELRAIKVYEEINRLLSGQVDFNKCIERVSKSFANQIMTDINTLWTGLTSTEFGSSYYNAGGAYDEGTLLGIIEHVEAVSGKQAKILGTKKALRKLMPSIMGSEARSDLYNLGYVGKFYSNPVIETPQRHAVGSTSFLLNDNALTIVASDDKMIKFVYEGDPVIFYGNPADNADLTQTYLYGTKYGVAASATKNTGVGRYEFTA